MQTPVVESLPVSVREVGAIADQIRGWLKSEEGPLLYTLAGQVTAGVIVEIGSWMGKSTTWLAWGSKHAALISHNDPTPVYAIDHHTGSAEHRKKQSKIWTFDQFTLNIRAAGVEEVVRPIVKPSLDAVAGWTDPIGLIFIDGSHDYDNVKADLDAWYPHVLPGGVVAFHDSLYHGYGVKRLITERVHGHPDFIRWARVQSITYAVKAPRRTV